MSFQADAFQNDAFQIGGASSIIGGHFLPSSHKRKATLSNINVIYNKARDLPRKETKELRDAISQFVEPELAIKAEVPDLAKVDYSALEANQMAYDKFSQALANIQERIEIVEQHKIALLTKQQQEDDELLLITIISCIIN